MAFRDAVVAKTISDGVTVDTDTTLDGSVGTAIDAAITEAAAITSVKTEKCVIDLSAVINGKHSPVEIIQSGGNLKLDDVLQAIKNGGFRVSRRLKKRGRVGGQDRVTLTIAWNSV